MFDNGQGEGEKVYYCKVHLIYMKWYNIIWRKNVIKDIMETLEHQKKEKEKRKKKKREFPGGLVVRILGFHCHGPGSIPGQGTEIPQAGHGQKSIYGIKPK